MRPLWATMDKILWNTWCLRFLFKSQKIREKEKKKEGKGKKKKRKTSSRWKCCSTYSEIRRQRDLIKLGLMIKQSELENLCDDNCLLQVYFSWLWSSSHHLVVLAGVSISSINVRCWYYGRIFGNGFDPVKWCTVGAVAIFIIYL